MDAAPWSVAGFYSPMYWGFVIATALVGTTFVQAYIFFDRSQDRWALQTVVLLLLLVDLTSTILMSITIFHYFLLEFGNYLTLSIVPLSWCVEYGMTALVTTITQLFFASRIRFVMRQYSIYSPFDKVIPILITFTALLGFTGGIAKTYYISSLPTSELSGIQIMVSTSVEEGSAVVSDILTTGTLCFILSSARGGIKRSKSPLRRLFFFILNRGILVTIVQVGMVVGYVIARSYLYWMPFHLCKSKLYTNTLLAMLNSRGSTKGWTVKTQFVRPSAIGSAGYEFAPGRASHGHNETFSNPTYPRSTISGNVLHTEIAPWLSVEPNTMTTDTRE